MSLDGFLGAIAVISVVAALGCFVSILACKALGICKD